MDSWQPRCLQSHPAMTATKFCCWIITLTSKNLVTTQIIRIKCDIVYTYIPIDIYISNVILSFIQDDESCWGEEDDRLLQGIVQSIHRPDRNIGRLQSAITECRLLKHIPGDAAFPNNGHADWVRKDGEDDENQYYQGLPTRPKPSPTFWEDIKKECSKK